MSHIGIIIVNYRTPRHVVECLCSLMTDKPLLSMSRIVIVENCSGDDSYDTLRDAIEKHGWSEHVHLLTAANNRGFGAGNNLAIQYYLHQAQHPAPEYIMCLNPDTIVPCGAIGHLRETLDRDPTVGIVGSQLRDAMGTLQRSCHALPSISGEFCEGVNAALLNRLLRDSGTNREGSDLGDCEWVSGGAFMIKTSVLRQVGLFDEQFFLYFEEVDLGRRVAVAGYGIQLAKKSIITHLEGCSTGSRNRLESNVAWQASRRIYFRKHHGRLGLLAADAARTLGKVCALLLHPVRAWARSRRSDSRNASPATTVTNTSENLRLPASALLGSQTGDQT
jgi:N-acetylglucosaminyl-diphospho-decaprenol L-rhamnosyltransferase